MATTKSEVKIEQANGDSFVKRVNSICRYFAALQNVTPEEKAKLVRESVIRSLEHCEIYLQIS